MYVTDNQKYPYAFYTDPRPLGPGNAMSNWELNLEKYCSWQWTNRAAHCPAYKHTHIWGFDPTVPGGTEGQWFGSYAYNVAGTGIDVGRDALGLGAYGAAPGLGAPYVPPIAEGQVKAPAEMFALGESWLYSSSILGSSVDTASKWRGIDFLYPGQTFDVVVHPPRHGEDYNVAYCDGHIKAINRVAFFDARKTAGNWNNDNQQHAETWASMGQ